jgi:hypothetical protein
MTHRDILPEWQMKGLVQRFLATEPHKIGETVQLGWFVFRVADGSQPPEVESLDFRAMASFTRDFSAAERVRDQQWEILCRFGVQAEPCTLMQTALVSRSYSPGMRDAFLERQKAAQGIDSGWYVGVVEEALDMGDERSFETRSLYELSIADERLVPYWLLPIGRKVMVSSGNVCE